MKQRITFLLHSLEDIDTDNVLFSDEKVKIPSSLFSLRQDRITLTKDELPQEVSIMKCLSL
ncbi:unnamed protein product [Cyberlindnera jadinii]|uniref:Uncharacterized protein n=1 Tax=Cyberlindnera jadinii (strain ATCC 18201 / CBS 1600 / BCRC 20928 / JCM 3617 / NBRC 0987 / NRRL Y-1542) TaxID=983966 RepID=A0A0H5C5A2_CYBJN|nr:unnamed protein product [Cyberlindnera jadinii]